jgi:hypothetical protein
MIVELVEFTHPPGSTRSAIDEGARATLPHWRANADLLRKHYLLGTDGQTGAGIYFWPSVEAAQRAHDAAWIAQAERRTGQSVRIRHFELLMTLDNQAGTLTEGAAGPPLT